MISGITRGDRLGLLAPAAALIAALLPATAAADRPHRPEPPTAAALRDATREALARPAFGGAPATLPRRGGGVEPEGDGLPFPSNRVVTLYGAPQLGATALGRRTPRGASRKVRKQARPYRRLGDREVIAGFDLVAVIATASPGADGMYRTRQPDEIIAEYLRRARSFGGRLVLDIQPGRASVLEAVRSLRRWIRQPDVDVAIDPEWNVGRRGVPGSTRGTIEAAEINAVSRELNRIVEDLGLPPKLLVVHQFHRGSVRHRKRIKQRDGVAAALNFDGIGAAAAKEAGYADLAREGIFNGFSVFYDLDGKLMRPRSILELVPAVDFLLYQ